MTNSRIARPGAPGKDSGAGQPKRTADFPGLIDVCDRDGRTVFLVRRGDKAEEVDEVDEWLIKGEPHVPPLPEHLPWLLPRVSEVRRLIKAAEPPDELFSDLVTYQQRYSALPSEGHYVILGAWIVHTHLMEWWDFSPCILFWDAPESGKSRAGRAATYAARRGLHTETLRPAAFIRDAQDRLGSIFLDLVDLGESARRADVLDLLNSRVERGIRASRVLNYDRGPFDDTRFFRLFGPLMAATNEPPHPIFATRCVRLKMQKSDDAFPIPSETEGRVFRERLTALRARLLHLKPELSEKPAPARAGDILQPLATVVDRFAPAGRPDFDKFVADLRAGTPIDRLGQQRATVIAAALANEAEVRKGFLPIETIAASAGLDPATVGRTLKALGCETHKRTAGRTDLLFDRSRLLRIATGGCP